jgi:ABC-type Na+ transport system ATPase subunit NatA
LQPGGFLQRHRLADGPVFGLGQGGCGKPTRVESLAGLLQLRRAKQAADMVSAERRFQAL